MKKVEFNLPEEIAAAVKNGDRRRLADLYRQQGSLYGDNYYAREMSWKMLEATEQAAKLNPGKLQRDIVLEILSIQGTLLHRVDEAIRLAMLRHDKNYTGEQPWGWLPPSITDELLPRFGKISAEVFATIRLLQKLDAPPAPNPQADQTSESDA